MVDLDTKLREILEEVESETNNTGGLSTKHRTRLVAQIKQVFKDDGWLREITLSLPAITNYDKSAVMTGQRFYERFKQNIDKEDWPTLPLSDKEVLTYVDVLEAAKRAGGVE